MNGSLVSKWDTHTAYSILIPELKKIVKNSYKSFFPIRKNKLKAKHQKDLAPHPCTTEENDRILSADLERKDSSQRILKPSKIPLTRQVKGKIFAKSKSR